MVVFLDTFAIIEIDHGNNAYKKYTIEVGEAITSALNLIEVYYTYLRLYGKREADVMYHKVKKITMGMDYEAIQAGCRIKLDNKKKRLSYADCMGYSLARQHGIPFITGDTGFKEFPGVEFLR